ncbi:O-linked N-acetylglucosamine transferase family protein [Neisseria perflava]|uniref:O-linked N-acetylglucosamine transferase, SPINDLY family protein n=1 Tax=Neisseria perflava TaxID=33053 RepID=UPI00209D5124|nr:tetratricopeptide repeat protein [Neisseria perflava]MCP1659284.1 putative O-linked N-acetylglucosamine transferase (SPINDLY family) [Neisseria perflava]
MAKKPQRNVTQKRPAAANPLMGKLFQKAGVATAQPAATAQTEQQVKDKLAQIQQTERERGVQEALALAQEALQAFPAHINLLNYTALLLAKNRRYPEAVETFKRIAGYDKNVGVLGNLAGAYREMKAYDQALAALDKALALNPKQPAVLLTKGAVLTDMGDYAQAADCFTRLLDIEPDNAAVAYNLGNVYKELGRLNEASDWYRRVLALAPQHTKALANWAFIQNYLVPYDAERIARETIAYAQACAAAHTSQLPPLAPAEPEKKLHIGLVTADLHDNHPVGYFIEGLLTADAVRQFDWSAYLNGEQNDRFTRRVKPLFRNWRNIQLWSDEKARGQIRSDGIDILIGLSGYNAHNRVGIFTAQTAPVQLEWLGWFATTGLPAMNGILADGYCVPESEEHLYSEKVYRLPHTRLCMQPPQEPVDTAPPPSLQKGYITFGCYQNPLKISDEVLQTWAHIAQQLPDARWAFKGKGQETGTPLQQQIARKLTAHGFNPAQLDFSGKLPRADYLRAYNDSDLILDTFPYPGGTTTADALWMAVPTITLTLPGMIARQGEQLMSAAGLAEFVCQTKDEYIEKALYWADEKNRTKLTALRARMRDQVLTSPVFDSKAFSEDWCKLIREIWRDQCSLRG